MPFLVFETRIFDELGGGTAGAANNLNLQRDIFAC